MVEWTTNDYMTHCFGPFSFHVTVAIPNAIPPIEEEQEWPDEPDDEAPGEEKLQPKQGEERGEERGRKNNGRRRPLMFECSPYDLELQDLLRPVSLSLDVFSKLWATSEHHHCLDGVLDCNDERFIQSFSSYFAMQPRHDGNTNDFPTSTPMALPFRSISYVSKSSMDESLLCMNIATAKNLDISSASSSSPRTSIRIEFRSKNIDAINQIKIHMKQHVWFQKEKHCMSFIQGQHSMSANSQLKQESLERAKEWLGM
jgi:hypothetical protein